MNTRLFSLVALATASIATAHATPTIYGALYPKAYTAYIKTTDKATGKTTNQTPRPLVYDDGSRIGVRGNVDLENDYKVSYRTEWRLSHDNEVRSWEPRDMWVGLGHKTYGTIKAGRMLTPEPYIEYGTQMVSVDGHRTNNSIRYESPTIKNTQVMAQYFMDENNETDSFGTDGYAVSIKHEKEDKYAIAAAYAYANAKKALHGDMTKDAFRATGYFKPTNTLKLGTLYQQNRYNEADRPLTEQALSLDIAYTGKPSYTYYGYVGHARNFDGRKGSQTILGGGLEKEFNQNVAGGFDISVSKEDYPTVKTESASLYLFGSYRF